MLNVFLGYACNLRCGYCLQAPEHEREAAKPLDISPFIEKVVPWVKKTGVRKIAYWGGEPLVYWRSITKIHKAFDEAGVKFDMVKIATNAMLMTDEHVEWMNSRAKSVYVIVSRHTGFGEPDWSTVAKLKNSSISYLFTSQCMYAWGWMRELDRLEQRYARTWSPFMHWIRATSGAEVLYHFTHRDLDKHVPHLWSLAHLAAGGHRHAMSMWAGALEEWRTKLRPGEEAPAMCYGDHQIDVDLNGDRYGCHHTVNAKHRVGELGGPIENDGAMRQVRKWIDTTECSSCPINTWCRGNCHLSATHDVDCRLSKEKHSVLSWLDTAVDSIRCEVPFRHD